MATKEQLIDALKRANAAGDIEAVNEIAAYIDSMEPENQQEPEQITAEQFQEQYGDIPDIESRIAPSQPQESQPSIADRAIGAGETALTAITGATGGLAGQVTGTIDQLIKEIRAGEFGSDEAANRIADRAQELSSMLTYEPRTEEGQEYVAAIGEAGEALAPLAGLGGQVAQIGQLSKASAPQVRQSLIDAADSSDVAKTIYNASREPGDIAKAIFSYQSPVKQRIGKLIEEGETDAETAAFNLSQPSSPAASKNSIARSLGIGAPKVKTDKVAKKAIDQGFDDGVIASIKGSAPADLKAMRKMFAVFEKGKKNADYRRENRPTDVVGDRLVDSVNAVISANKKAGKDINKAAESLKGKYIDAQPIGNRFIESLEDAGVTVGDDLKLSFKGSDFEDLPAVERIIQTVFRRMSGPSRPSSYELHRMKRFIDEQVTYGKGGEGLAGRAESLLKSLRRDIDETLDRNYPEYDKANTIYSDTINALDEIQGVAGRKVNLEGKNANKSLGTLMRRVLSNATSRVNVIDAAENIEAIANKYPGKIMIEGPDGTRKKPNIGKLVMFADELDSRFGPTARGSIQGQMEQVANRSRNIAQSQSPTLAAADAVVGFAARGLDKARGVSDEKALDAMRSLLSERK